MAFAIRLRITGLILLFQTMVSESSEKRKQILFEELESRPPRGGVD
jgi:hypothetical protein